MRAQAAPVAPAVAPTAAEIRAQLVDHGTYPKDHPAVEQLEELIDDWSDAIASPAFDALESPDERSAEIDATALWGDLRPSEAIKLRDLARAAVQRAQERCQAIILEELTGAGVAFAAAYPDAPRPPRR